LAHFWPHTFARRWGSWCGCQRLSSAALGAASGPTRHHGRRSQCRSWHKRGGRYPPCVSLPCDRIHFCVCTAQLVESLTTRAGLPTHTTTLAWCVMNTSTVCHTLSISVGLPSCCCRCCLFCCACRRTALSSTMQHHELLLGHDTLLITHSHIKRSRWSHSEHTYVRD
jgi:hypothetical protein